MDIRTALKLGIAQLRAAHVPSDTLAAELLLLHATGRTRTSLYSHPEDALTESESQNYFSWIERRAAGVPTQHLAGKQEFWGLEFEVARDVLIPRPETEHLIEVALDRLGLREVRQGRSQETPGDGLLIADVGTGSGCIVVALAKELPGARFFATDVSAASLAVARRNAARHSVSDRIHFLESNLLEKLSSVGAQHAAPLRKHASGTRNRESRITSHESHRFDLIVSNPPYIGRREASALPREVREHEPEVALYGGAEGYELYPELIAQAAAKLKPGGLLVLELGHDSLPAVRPLFDGPVWTDVSVTNDLAGVPRVLAAQRL